MRHTGTRGVTAGKQTLAILKLMRLCSQLTSSRSVFLFRCCRWRSRAGMEHSLPRNPLLSNSNASVCWWLGLGTMLMPLLSFCLVHKDGRDSLFPARFVFAHSVPLQLPFFFLVLSVVQVIRSFHHPRFQEQVISTNKKGKIDSFSSSSSSPFLFISSFVSFVLRFRVRNLFCFIPSSDSSPAPSHHRILFPQPT